MDWLRKKVSGKRNRYKDEDFNLDITYITDNVLAMSFPASGVESVYRNKIGKVAEFLELKHSGNYRIINLSNRSYNETKFKGKVLSYVWEDHHSPAIDVLFQWWYDMYEFLNRNTENVVVVHCNAGKGRTGTAIASYFLFANMYKNADEAIEFYGKMRFKHGIGITNPCQLRYVRYLDQILKGRTRTPTVKIIKSIEMHGVPNMKNKTCKPYIEVIQVRDLEVIFSGKKLNKLNKYHSTKSKVKSPRSENIIIERKGTDVENSDKSSTGEMDADKFFKQAENRDRSGRWSTKYHWTEMNYRKSTMKDDEGEDLFRFDSNDWEIRETTKRRSNSMGKDILNEEDKTCK